MEVGDEELRTVFSEEYLDAELRNRFEELKNSPYVPTEVLIAICVQGFVAFIGILANLLVIIVTIFGNTRQESSSIIYVTNLSISNFIFLTCVPFKIHENIYLKWKFGQVWCQISFTIKFLNFTVLALFLMAMSVDRYLAVNRPLSSSHLRSRRAAIIASATLWLLSLAGTLPLGWFHSSTHFCSPNFPGQIDLKNFNRTFFLSLLPNSSQVTECKFPSVSPSLTVYVICNFFYSFLIPFVVIVACYCAIVHRVRNPVGVINAKGRHQRIVRRKVTQMAVFLVISYSICYIPYYVFMLMKVVGIPVAALQTCFRVDRFNNTMAYINSAVHPLLYIFTSGQFQKQFALVKKKVLRFFSHRNIRQTSVVSANTKRTTIKTNSSPTRDMPEPVRRPLVSDSKGEGTQISSTGF